MKPENAQTRIQTIAIATLETVRKLALEEKGLSVEELTASLSADGALLALLDQPTGTEKFHKNEVLRLKKELGKLTELYDKTAGQRRELAIQLDAAEARNSRGNEFIRRALPALIQLVRIDDNKTLQDHLEHTKNLAKKSASLDQLEGAIQQLKDVSFRNELKKQAPKTSPGKTSTLFNLFRRQGHDVQPDIIVYFKEMYLEIIQELRLNLDQAALGELTGIEERIGNTQRIDDFSPIRKEVLLLLKKYILRVSTERKEAAAFILEIGKRLAEVERHVSQSIAVAQETREARTQFTNTIENEMTHFQEAVDFTSSLEELKSKVVASISIIKRAIETSRQDETHRYQQADKEVAVLKKNLERMKNEIQSAKVRSETLEEELLSDPLTHTHNRRAYDQRIDDEINRYHRYHTVFSMLLLDVDHFKHINDRYGHSVGDLCLKEIIHRIKPLLRETDFMARFGGEEFIIILPETVRDGAEKAAEKIRMHIEKTDFLHKGDHVKVTISLGGTEVNASDKTGEAIFERVDKAMYQAKNSGRNKVVMI